MIYSNAYSKYRILIQEFRKRGTYIRYFLSTFWLNLAKLESSATNAIFLWCILSRFHFIQAALTCMNFRGWMLYDSLGNTLTTCLYCFSTFLTRNSKSSSNFKKPQLLKCDFNIYSITENDYLYHSCICWDDDIMTKRILELQGTYI